MSLEQMNKPELVKLARATEQELKELKQSLEEVNKELSELKKEQTKVDSEVNLPYTAVAIIPNNKVRLARTVVVKFNLNGDSKIESDKEYEEHQAHFRAEEVLAKMEKLNKIKE